MCLRPDVINNHFWDCVSCRLALLVGLLCCQANFGPFSGDAKDDDNEDDDADDDDGDADDDDNDDDGVDFYRLRFPCATSPSGSVQSTCHRWRVLPKKNESIALACAFVWEGYIQIFIGSASLAQLPQAGRVHASLHLNGNTRDPKIGSRNGCQLAPDPWGPGGGPEVKKQWKT